MAFWQNLTDLIRLNWHLYHYSPRRISLFQQKAVLDLLARVRRDSPFYQELYAGLTVHDLQDFSRLPTINKAAMMAGFDRLNTAGLRLAEVMTFALAKELAHDYLGYFQDRYVVGLSSGTSGNKGIYITDRKMTRRLPGVFLARGGVRLADLPLRILFLLRVFSQGFADINAPLIQLRYLPSMTEPAEIIAELNQMHANILMAPPSLLRQLLPLAGKVSRPPRRVITYAEVLELEEKSRIAAAFRAPVVEIYQASEGQIASPCRRGNLHINEDLVYVELLAADGRTPVTRPGERAAKMLVTNLVNTVQPLLRYEMNDIIELGEPCPCGSHFRVISRIVGRQDDVLHLRTQAGGLRAVYPDLVSRWIITTDDRIREFSVVQDADDHLEIILDLAAGSIAGEISGDIAGRLRQRFREELSVYDITCRLDIRMEPIPLPADNRKMKRFRYLVPAREQPANKEIRPALDTNLPPRPVFPKRAVVTAGMPYGNKALHLGHIGGVFVPADIFARFLRDRIGSENVIFISGTDCYGSPIQESYHRAVADGQFSGSLTDYVAANHHIQKQTLDHYRISLDLYAASALGRAGEIHRKLSAEILQRLYRQHRLVRLSQNQFFDPERQVFLNGRQVTGRCPIEGCRSEVGYADECALGHQYPPTELIQPISALTGRPPVMKAVTNWYFRLEDYRSQLADWVEKVERLPSARKSAVNSIREFLEPPVIFLQRKFMEQVRLLESELPPCDWLEESGKSSVRLRFANLAAREQACGILSSHNIFYRTGKTLVPFRLTGNVTWGVPAPEIEDLTGLTFWVWPESLWAPISFSRCLLESEPRRAGSWEQWWCSKDAQVCQFIGEDNVYFYGPAQMALFMALQDGQPSPDPPEGELQLTKLIVNSHLLFLDRKASSSGKIKPPTGEDLLKHYTSDQLRAHFCSLSLGVRSVAFQPKPFNPQAPANEGDPVLKEGNLLSNVLNRAVRSCFYTVQKYCDGIIPRGTIDPVVRHEADRALLAYEKFMAEHTFHQVMILLDSYIREINKHWSRVIREAEPANDFVVIRQLLVDTFHKVRVSALMMHPIAPDGTEMIRDYLRLDERFWDWNHAFETIYYFMPDPASHSVRQLEPRVDFFPKHPSQLAQESGK